MKVIMIIYYYLKLFKHCNLSVLYWFSKGRVLPLRNLINLHNYDIYKKIINLTYTLIISETNLWTIYNIKN